MKQVHYGRDLSKAKMKQVILAIMCMERRVNIINKYSC